MADLDQANTTVNISRVSHPIGVASLPRDTKLDDVECSEGSIEICVVIDGGVTFLFENGANFSNLHQQLNALAFIKNLITNIGKIDGIGGITYMGPVDEIPLNNANMVIPFVNRGEEIVNNNYTVTPFGFIIVSAAAIIFFVAAALLIMKKRSRAHHNRYEEVSLSGQEHNYLEEVIEGSTIQNGTQRLDSYTSRESQNNFHNIPHDNADNCSPLHELIEIDEPSQISDFSTQYCTHVRQCVSATCEVCRQNATEKTVRFVRVDAEAGERLVSIGAGEHGVEVVGDLRSPSSLSRRHRSYETPDTVEF